MNLRPASIRLGPVHAMLGLLVALSTGPTTRAADTLELLREAIDKWSNERDAWAFTQKVREFDDAGTTQTRVERFDPSLSDKERWTLVSINGRAPTTREISDFKKSKGDKRRHKTKPPSEYVAFERVAVLAEYGDTIHYAVPLRKDVSRLIPLERLTVVIGVDRSRRSVRNVAINLDDPLNIALGLAQVTEMHFDLRFDPVDSEHPDTPQGVLPIGTAEAAMAKFGNRAEFSWSEFERVRTAKSGPENLRSPQ